MSPDRIQRGHHELGCADGDVLLEPCRSEGSRPTGITSVGSRPGDGRATLAPSGTSRSRRRQHAEVLRVDPSIVGGCDLGDHLPPLGHLPRGREPRQPAVTRSTSDPPSSDGARPPSHTSSGSWTGRRRRWTPSTSPPAHRPADHGERLVEQPGPLVAPHTERLLFQRQPSTEADRGRSRPPESRSRLASDFASTTGLRPGSTSTLVPSLRRLVLPAATANPMSGSGEVPVSRSDIHNESKPIASSPSTNSTEPATVPRSATSAPVP